MLSSVEHSSIKQQPGRREGGWNKGSEKCRKKGNQKRWGETAGRRKEGDKGGDSEGIWNMFTVISQGPDVIVVLHLVDQNFTSNFSIICPFSSPPCHSLPCAGKTVPCKVLLHYLCRNSLFLLVCPTSLYCLKSLSYIHITHCPGPFSKQ